MKIWASEWFGSRKVPGVRYRFRCDGFPVGQLNLQIEGLDKGPYSVMRGKMLIRREATKRYPRVLRQYGDDIGVSFIPHPDPFHLEDDT